MILKGKVALVLGAIKGIGKAIGLTLAKEGVVVAINYFDWEESLVALENDLAKVKAKYAVFKTNLLDTEAVAVLINRVIERFGRLDILVNNIERGGWPVVHGPYVQSQWDLEMNTTLRAKWWVYRHALPHLKETGNGVVVNISSIAAVVGRCGPAGRVFNDGYAAANRAVSSFTEMWAREAAPEVRVNELMLGFVETRHGPATRGWEILTERQQKELIDTTPLKKIGRVEDVAKAALFVVRDAPFMTGTVIRLDGGYALGGAMVEPLPKGLDDV